MKRKHADIPPPLGDRPEPLRQPSSPAEELLGMLQQTRSKGLRERIGDLMIVAGKALNEWQELAKQRETKERGNPVRLVADKRKERP